VDRWQVCPGTGALLTLQRKETAMEPSIEQFSASVRQALGDVFRAAEELLEAGAKITAQPHAEQLPETVRRLLRTVSNSMRSVLILVEHGGGTDALKIARTMFETAVNIHYLHSHPETLQDYVDFQWIKKKKHHDYLLKFAPAQAQRVDQATLSELNAEFARASPRFMGPKGRVRSQWHKSDHREIARNVGGEIIYGGVYPFVSSLTHMDILGLIIASGPNGEVEAVPSGSNLVLGLQIGMVSYAMALIAANEILKGGAEDAIQAAFQRFKESASVTQALNLWAKLGKNDGT
jgi:hypothetical protein